MPIQLSLKIPCYRASPDRVNKNVGNRQAGQVRTHLRKSIRLPLSRDWTASARWGVPQAPLNTPPVWLRDSCEITIVLLPAAPKDFLFERFALRRPFLKCDRCWPWLSAGPSSTRGSGDNPRKPLSSPTAVWRTRRSGS